MNKALLKRPTLLSTGFPETPEYLAVHAEYLAHCASIGNIVANASDARIAEARVKRYLHMVDMSE